MAFAGAIENQLDLIGQFELTAGVVTRLLLPLSDNSHFINMFQESVKQV